mmetsp:Transcript_15072/g.25513  ORF Transcript_15072/g.25513 Transcript_15072/m.25513 type:complete len:254 (-) Transcript_15072:449-1210(-)
MAFIPSCPPRGRLLVHRKEWNPLQAEKGLNGGGRVTLAHQTLPHQEGLDPCILHHLNVRGCEDAALTHHQDTPLTNFVPERPGHEVHRHVQSHLKGAEVAVVDAQQLKVVQLKHPLHLLVSVHLQQDGHVEGVGDLHEILEVLVGQDGGDEQDGVRPKGARQVDLVRLHDELLAEQRALDPRGADELQVLVAALEELLVREHAQARGAALLVFHPDAHRVEVGLHDAFAGRGLLDLGDERGLAGARLELVQRA